MQQKNANFSQKIAQKLYSLYNSQTKMQQKNAKRNANFSQKIALKLYLLYKIIRRLKCDRKKLKNLDFNPKTALKNTASDYVSNCLDSSHSFEFQYDKI